MVGGRSHIDALDGLRGLAAMTVVFAHFTNETGFMGRLLGGGAGQNGVMLFFCLSGYLMGSLYLGTPMTRSSVAEFGRRRIARVVPLYLLVVAVSHALVLLTGRGAPFFDVTSDNLLEHLSFVRGEGVLWTVAVEVQFYAVFPLLWWIGRRTPALVIAALATVLALHAALGFPREPLVLRSLPYFLTGVCVSFVPRPAPSRVLTGAFVLAVLGYVATLPTVSGWLTASAGVSSRILFPTVPWNSPIMLAVIPFLLWTSTVAPAAQTLLGNRAGKGLGRVSYSLYLLHLPVLAVLAAIPALRQNTLVFLLVFLLAAVMTAAVSYRLVERPLGARIRKSGRLSLGRSARCRPGVDPRAAASPPA